MTETQSQSRAQLFAGQALKDLSSGQKHELSGQSRMIAAFLFAHAEGFFDDASSANGVQIDLTRAYEQISTKHVDRAQAIEATNFLLEHLFGVMEYSSDANVDRYVPAEGWTTRQVAAIKQALRRVLPTVAHLIKGAGESPVITTDFSDKAMMDSGAAVSVVPTTGRLKVRQDLASRQAQLDLAAEAGQDLAKHPPVLIDGTPGRNIALLGRVAKERLGLATAPEDRAVTALQAAIKVLKRTIKVGEELPDELEPDARAVCLTLVHSLYADPEASPTAINLPALERDLARAA